MGLFRRLWGRLRGETSGSSGLTTIKLPDGRRMIVDQIMLDYLRSTAPDPSQKSLDAVLAEMQRVRVFRGGSASGEPISKQVLFETGESRTLSMLRDALRIHDGPGGHCMCVGGPTIELLGASGERLAVIAVHHGQSIRWKAWRDDARLVEGRSLLEWLAARGATYPLEEYEADLRRREAEQAAWDRWEEAMPPCLKRFAAQMRESLGLKDFVPSPQAGVHGVRVSAPSGPATAGEESLDVPDTDIHAVPNDVVPLLHELEMAYPDRATCALVLFAWFGTGASPWTGFPAYESVVESLLMTFHLEDLLHALESADLTDAQLEGAARLFGGWEFRTKRGKELAHLPTSLKRRLFEHSMRSADTDKRSRAHAAFAS